MRAGGDDPQIPCADAEIAADKQKQPAGKQALLPAAGPQKHTFPCVDSQIGKIEDQERGKRIDTEKERRQRQDTERKRCKAQPAPQPVQANTVDKLHDAEKRYAEQIIPVLDQ